MGEVYSSSIVEEQEDCKQRLDYPNGNANTRIELREGETNGAEQAEEPEVPGEGTAVITKQKDWKDLKGRADKRGIRRLLFNVASFYRKLKIQEFPDVEEICIKNNSLPETKRFVVETCNALKAITIGDYCLTGKDENKDTTTFSVNECPKLERIIVGDHSCTGIKTCEVDSPSLTEFTYGVMSFSNCRTVMQLNSRTLLFLLISRWLFQNHLEMGQSSELKREYA